VGSRRVPAIKLAWHAPRAAANVTHAYPLLLLPSCRSDDTRLGHTIPAAISLPITEVPAAHNTYRSRRIIPPPTPPSISHVFFKLSGKGADPETWSRNVADALDASTCSSGERDA
jgi:hypothetical protein